MNKLDNPIMAQIRKSVSLEYIAEFIVAECGVENSQKLVNLINLRLEDETRKSLRGADCEHCHGTGTMFIANGADDYYKETCICQPVENN